MFGGVSYEFVAAGYALIAGSTILSAAIGVNAACRSIDTRTALVRTYTHVVAFVCVLPLSLKLSSFDILAYEGGVEGFYRLKLHTSSLQLEMGFGYAIIQAAIGVALLIRATHLLRTHEPTAGAIAPTAYPEPPRRRPTPVVFNPSVRPTLPLPPLNEADPVLWWERHIARTRPLPILDIPARWLGGILAVIASVSFIKGAWELLRRAVLGLNPEYAHQLSNQGMERLDGGVWLITAGVLAAGLFLFPLTVGVIGSIAGERDKRTFDSLLMTLIPRRIILWSKVRAHIEAGLVFGVGSVTAIGCCFGAEAGMPLALVAMATVIAGFWFVIAIVAWLTVWCKTPGQAFRFCLLPVCLAIALPFIAWRFTDWNNLGPTLTTLCWASAILTLMGCVLWWRAVVDLDRGD